MAQITRLYNYVNNTVANADHVRAEFDQLINESNAQDTRLERIKLDSDDGNPSFLLSKFLAGENIVFTEVEEEGVRKIRVAASGEVSLDHNLAANRDMEDQHPMSSITGLLDALDFNIPDESITVDKLADNSVASNKIVNLAITNAKLANSSVGASKLVDSAVETAKINNGAVNADKLASNAVTNVKIADGTIAETKLVTAVQNKLAADRTRKITVSSSDPSGGADGDIWIRY